MPRIYLFVASSLVTRLGSKVEELYLIKNKAIAGTSLVALPLLWHESLLWHRFYPWAEVVAKEEGRGPIAVDHYFSLKK